MWVVAVGVLKPEAGGGGAAAVAYRVIDPGGAKLLGQYAGQELRGGEGELFRVDGVGERLRPA